MLYITQSLTFQLSGSCHFDTVFAENSCNQAPLKASSRKGRVVGSWHWQFSNGLIGETVVHGRTTAGDPPQASLLGIIKIPMFGIIKRQAQPQLLFLSFESTRINIDNANNITVVIRGTFRGGTGEYKNVKGTVDIVSVNGLIEQGEGAFSY